MHPIHVYASRPSHTLSLTHKPIQARVVADVHFDSSVVSDSLTSQHQARLLDAVYGGDRLHRPKMNVFIAERVSPKMKAVAYLDGDKIEAELKQVVGDTRHAFDITDNDVVIFGATGVLFAGPECMRHETLLLAYISLRAREEFISSFFGRLVIMDAVRDV